MPKAVFCLPWCQPGRKLPTDLDEPQKLLGATVTLLGPGFPGEIHARAEEGLPAFGGHGETREDSCGRRSAPTGCRDAWRGVRGAEPGLAPGSRRAPAIGPGT